MAVPNNFVDGTTALPDEVNANFASTDADIATNVADIATNTADIATNTADIATNTAAIAAFSSGGGDNNLIINPCFGVAQRGVSGAATFTAATTPANSDDTYLLDRWILLSDGPDIVDVSQSAADAPTGAWNCVKCLVATANKKWGLLQVIEGKNSEAVIGSTASYQLQAKIAAGNTTLENLKVYILAWDGAVDTVTSDIVSAWNAAETNITPAANWTIENTPSCTVLTSTYAEITEEAIAIDTASTTNVAIFIMCDDTDATVGDIVYISLVKVEPGDDATTFVQRPITTELALCQRYYFKSFIPATAPAQNAGIDGAIHMQAANTGRFTTHVQFPVEMRAAGTTTFYNPLAANAEARNQIDGTTSPVQVGGAANVNNMVIIPGAAPDATDANDYMAVHVQVEAEL